MARRLKSSRRSRVESSMAAGQAHPAAPPPAPPPRPNALPVQRRPRLRKTPAPAVVAAPPDTASPAPAIAPPPPSAAPPQAGPNWFAEWRFPTLFFLVSFTLALGIIYWDWFRPSASAPAPSLPGAKSPVRRQRLITSESFEWLYRLRETEVVTGNLEKEFADAQQFYRDNPVDEFLELDPWTLPTDQLAYLRHFCEKGFFTVEREILLKLLERQFDRSSTAAPGLSNASSRLAQAVTDRETRLLNLREAVDLYRRGRDSEVTVPINPTPEQDQTLRAEVVDRLAAVRRQRESLDARIKELEALVKSTPDDRRAVKDGSREL